MSRLIPFLFAIVSSAASQAPPQQPSIGSPLEQPGVTPAEIQRMFDAYALLQAQDQLKITDEQYSQFLSRFKALQDVRRKGLQERMRILQELRKLTADGQPVDEAQIRDKLRALEEVDARLTADVRRAYDAVDQVLDVRQQARFRLFEEQMERRKIELLTRARLANRPKTNQKTP
jgi:Spy/CpxP family protein refolding chaperone